GAGEIISWLLYGPVEPLKDGMATYAAKHSALFGIAGLWLVGLVLTAGPVVYNTVAKSQTFLVATILVLVLVLSVFVVRLDAVTSMARGLGNIGGMPNLASSDLSLMTLLGALAFAGAGGTMNL